MHLDEHSLRGQLVGVVIPIGFGAAVVIGVSVAVGLPWHAVLLTVLAGILICAGLIKYAG